MYMVSYPTIVSATTSFITTSTAAKNMGYKQIVISLYFKFHKIHFPHIHPIIQVVEHKVQYYMLE